MKFFYTNIRMKLTILLIAAGLNPLMSQHITQIQPKQNGNTIEINYKIAGAKFDDKFDITLFVSFDGGNTFKGPVKSVSGDLSVENAKGTKTIVWDAFKDVTALDGDIIFDVRADVQKLPVDKVLFAQYSGGIMLSSMDYNTPFGFMVGSLGKLGWFGAVRLNSLTMADYTFDGEKMDQDILYQFDDKIKYPRISAVAGATYQIGWKTFVYGGLGYGIKNYYQQIDEFSQTDASPQGKKWVGIDAYQQQGFEIELGSIIKINNLNFSLGCNVFNFEHISLNAGLGWSF